jgi:hypothetical protein
MFPPRMKMGVLSVMFACQQHDAAQILRLAIKEVPNLLQICCHCPSQDSSASSDRGVHLKQDVHACIAAGEGRYVAWIC